jgi:hypothetical protein
MVVLKEYHTVVESHQGKTVFEAAQPYQEIQVGQSEGSFTLSLPVQAGNGHGEQSIVVGRWSKEQMDALVANLGVLMHHSRTPLLGELKASLADPRRRS